MEMVTMTDTLVNAQLSKPKVPLTLKQVDSESEEETNGGEVLQQSS